MARINEDMTYGYFPIVKYDETADGLLVYGKAAGPGLDLDGQRFSAEYLKSAVPEWMKWGNVREQHSPIAAGVGRELTQDGDTFWVKALVVDDNTIKKVKTGVLKGFSPGIKNGRVVKHASAPNGLIVGGEMVELSLVDRPSDPTNLVSICKAFGGGTLMPVDASGNQIKPEGQGTVYKWLTADLHKGAVATALDVLNGEYEEADQETAAVTIGSLADLLIAEGMMLKAADLSQPYDISNLVNAYDGITSFIEGDGYPGMTEDFEELTKAAGAGGGRSANIDTAEMVKAAVAEINKSWEAKFESLNEELVKVKAMPIPGGPVVRAPQTAVPVVNKAAVSDRFLAEANRPGLDPGLAHLYNQAAAREGSTS